MDHVILDYGNSIRRYILHPPRSLLEDTAYQCIIVASSHKEFLRHLILIYLLLLAIWYLRCLLITNPLIVVDVALCETICLVNSIVKDYVNFGFECNQELLGLNILTELGL